MPTSAQYSFTLSTVDPVINPEDAMESILPVPIAASQTLAAGTVLGKVTATGKFLAYASGASDGSQIPAGILRRAATTDSAGVITNANEWGGTMLEAPMYTQGAFNCSELTGLDANAVTVLGGHLIGSISTGLFTF